MQSVLPMQSYQKMKMNKFVRHKEILKSKKKICFSLHFALTKKRKFHFEYSKKNIIILPNKKKLF